MKYAILQGEKITYAPKLLRLDDGRTVSNPNEATLRQAGYKPVRESAMPSEDGYYFTKSYTETEDEILSVWEKHKIPEPELSELDEFFGIVKGDIE